MRTPKHSGYFSESPAFDFLNRRPRSFAPPGSYPYLAEQFCPSLPKLRIGGQVLLTGGVHAVHKKILRKALDQWASTYAAYADEPVRKFDIHEARRSTYLHLTIHRTA